MKACVEMFVGFATFGFCRACDVIAWSFLKYNQIIYNISTFFTEPWELEVVPPPRLVPLHRERITDGSRRVLNLHLIGVTVMRTVCIQEGVAVEWVLS